MSVYGPYQGVIRDVHDGDTVGLDIDLGFGVAVTTRSVATGKRLMTCRLYGIDAPELRVRDASGHMVDNPAGIAARDYLAQLLPPGTVVSVISHLWDREGGRFDGSLWLDPVSEIALLMVANGHATPWDGTGAKP